MIIKDVDRCDRKTLEMIAGLMHEGFPHAYRNEKESLVAATDLTEGDYIVMVAMVDETIVGVIAAKAMYKHTGWEMHPLVVTEKQRHKGIGRALVERLEERLQSQGCVTLYLGTDDEFFETSASDIDLYNDIPHAIKHLKNKKHHPFTFYQKVGYTVTGFIPDANGINKPDIIMAKRMKLQKR